MGLYPVVKENSGDCHPPYWATLVTKTNLLLLVVERGPWNFKHDCKKPPDTKPKPTSNSTTSRDPCHKLELGQLYRRRLEGCFTYHDKVTTIFILNKYNKLKFSLKKLVKNIFSLMYFKI